MSAVDELVDRFVAAINTQKRDRRFEAELSPSVRAATDAEGLCEWSIIRCNAPWLAEVAQELPARLPESYYSFASRYCFPAFEVGPIVFHANTPEAVGEFEFRERLQSDPNMSPLLLEHGFIQFGKPANWSYDPVCFDTRNRSGRGREYSVVRIDHEDVLIRRRVEVAEVLCKSLRELMDRTVAAG